MEILLIGKDSPHRRFMINKLLDAGYNLTTCIFSSAIVKPRFEIDLIGDNQMLIENHK